MFQHLEDTLFRSNDSTTLYHKTAMLWYHMKHQTRCDHYCDVISYLGNGLDLTNELGNPPFLLLKSD